MDITAEIAAVQNRIAEITGISPPPSVPPGFAAALNAAMNPAPAVAPVAGPAMRGGALPGGALPGSAPMMAGMPFESTQSAASNAPAPVAPAEIDALVQQNAATWQVDPALLKAVIANESGFNANATSKVGAQGLMQLMPATAASLGVRDAYDPAQNVAGGARYLKGLLDRFGGDQRLAVAAYNAGPGAVTKYGDVPPYAETQSYVTNVLASADKYRSR